MDNSTNKNQGNEDKLPTFPDTLYPQLPQFLQDAVSHATSNQERDMLLLGAITSISSCIPKVYGIYDKDKVYSNLYLFVTAPASSGKGKLNKSRLIINKIHKSLRAEMESLNEDYKKDLAYYNKNKKNNSDLVRPKKPTEKMLFIPANNSSTGMFQLLNDNDEKGIIFETEGDTLTQAFKSDYGDYSDGFRKAFHHEPITYFRRTDREYVEIEKPKLSVVLSGTPGQVISLIPRAEDGLFSRFMFYYLVMKSEWINPYDKSDTEDLDLKYKKLGDNFFEFYKLLNDSDEIKISISDVQGEKSFEYFSKLQAKYENIDSDGFIANVRRLGLISFRLIMILTTLRIMEDGSDVPNERECSDIDYDSVLKMIPILTHHSRKVFFTLNKVEKPAGHKSSKEEFIEALPKTFSRKDYISIAKNKGIKDKTAEGYISKLVKDGILYKKSHNNYINTLFPEDGES
ncbi:uncharacterized protein DUF3987 [Lutibacter oceani]|uniref:Uncharacterized protein DUF3987 n=1 Tax=Lutibacter oceani TaxID=1853311 RepID=A0A3D9RQF2_9FLAO|nr:DUF3987 domain-containing protein [Lutibacter oceani]REE82140.1 uncharacterized protein DUF3987 [Lutibacter oceani]